MKRQFVFALVALAFTMIFVVKELRAQDSNIGLTFGLDYVSNYIYKDSYYFFGHETNGGAFIPYAFYNVLDTGFKLGMRADLSEIWFGSDKEETPQRDIRDWQSINFNIEYVYNFEKFATIGAGAWYFRYKTWDNGVNISSFEYCLFAVLNALPLNPSLRIIYAAQGGHDWIPETKLAAVSARFGLEHSFELLNETHLNLGADAGFIHDKKYDIVFGDINNIDMWAGISTKSGILTFTTSFHYLIFPGTQFKYTGMDTSGNLVKDINRFYTRLGVACSI